MIGATQHRDRATQSCQRAPDMKKRAGLTRPARFSKY
jgi:hypothetical protein